MKKKKQERDQQLSNLLREVGLQSVTVEIPVRSWFFVHHKLVAGLNASTNRPKEVVELIMSLGDMLVNKGVVVRSELDGMYNVANIEREK